MIPDNIYISTLNVGDNHYHIDPLPDNDIDKKHEVAYIRKDALWKPTDEQMKALETAERWYSDNMGCNFALVSLCEQLKKLM
ncbi:MAG: hypothetical protein J6T10_13045 [Methanobrevibacter sp.]|nr:hypothetical protein [Methanobrevibacter sp.]